MRLQRLLLPPQPIRTPPRRPIRTRRPSLRQTRTRRLRQRRATAPLPAHTRRTSLKLSRHRPPRAACTLPRRRRSADMVTLRRLPLRRRRRSRLRWVSRPSLTSPRRPLRPTTPTRQRRRQSAATVPLFLQLVRPRLCLPRRSRSRSSVRPSRMLMILRSARRRASSVDRDRPLRSPR